jgi:hypothetical protein
VTEPDKTRRRAVKTNDDKDNVLGIGDDDDSNGMESMRMSLG